MIEDAASLCYYSRTADRCREKSVVHSSCKVEGTEIHLCQRHWDNWMRVIAGDESLKTHCPRCVTAYVARREMQAMNPAVAVADEPITGPLADAIDNAMHAEGILAPTRRAILRRLAADNDAYVAAVMSRSAATIV